MRRVQFTPNQTQTRLMRVRLTPIVHHVHDNPQREIVLQTLEHFFSIYLYIYQIASIYLLPPANLRVSLITPCTLAECDAPETRAPIPRIDWWVQCTATFEADG